MDRLTLLKRANIKPAKPIPLIKAEEALRNLLEAIEEYCPCLEVDRMTKEDILTLLESYGSCVVDYHPENYHQERAALLKNFEMLRRYGLKDSDYQLLDFC
jgi:hypothetical protein